MNNKTIIEFGFRIIWRIMEGVNRFRRITPSSISTILQMILSLFPVPSWLDSCCRGHGFESRSTFTCLKTLQFLTESAFDMRKKKTSNENKKASPFNKHHGTMHYCNVHYGLPHLTFTYAVDKYSSTCKWIIIHCTWLFVAIYTRYSFSIHLPYKLEASSL